MKRAEPLLVAAPFEGLLITYMANQRRLLWVPAAILAAAVAFAILAPVRYSITSQVLVALGPEYTYRAPAGEQAGVSPGLDREQTMHTESEILDNADLHRATLRAIGVGRLYPKIAHPGLLSRAMAAVSSRIDAAGRWAGLIEGKTKPAPDPVERALKPFEAALSADVPKIGSVITETFKHKDAALGAETLNTMMQLYIDRRADLYRDDQSGIVARQVEIARSAWVGAEDRLAQFKLLHQASGFDAQHDILLHRQGAMRADRTDAQSQIAQLRARLADLAKQEAHVSRDIPSGHETNFETRLSPARASLEQLQAQYSKALEQYQPGAPLVQSLHAQLEARRADLVQARSDRSATSISTSQNPAWLTLQDDRLKSETDLAAASSRLEQDTLHLSDIGHEVTKLERSEQELGQLQLQKAISEETWRNATKTLEDRRVTDEVEARRRPTVRVLQSAVPPISPPPQRAVILGAGIVLALFGLLGATLLTHAFGRTYWQSEALEQDFGMAVLVNFPDLSPGAVGPGLAEAA